MSNFDIIEFGFNTADETVNFGTRSLADGDNLYEASTLATLKPSNGADANLDPYINAVVKNGSIYFSIDNSLRIFEDKQCSYVAFSATFSAVVDSFCVSSDCEYLLVCLRNGTVQLIDQNNENKCVFTDLCERDEDCDRFFINSFVYNLCFVFVTKQGKIYQLDPRHFELKCVHVFNFATNVASFKAPFLLLSGTKLAVLNLESRKSVIDSEDNQFKKIYPLRNNFFALDFEGKLYKICAMTLLIFPINSQHLYRDMLLISDSNEEQVVVTEDEMQQKSLQLLSYPALSKIYGLNVKTDIYLISPECVNDELLYISKIVENNSVSELRFHMVYETDAEQRLARLLRKRKYEEAERFAALFHLDASLVNEAKAQDIVDKMTCTSEEIDQLINLLNLIDNDVFKLQSCLGVTCSKFEDVRKILEYGCTLQLKKVDNEAEKMQNSVIDVMARFETFGALSKRAELDIQTWQQFANADLMDEVKSFLQNHEIEEAKIIYSRLDVATIETLTDDKISDILNILNMLPPATYQSFLSIFIPVTLSLYPTALPLIVKWTRNKVFSLEQHSKSDFPSNAIILTKKIIALMKMGDVADISFQRQHILHRDSLSELLATLEIIKTLKEEYRISVPVQNYLTGPQNVIRILLNVEMCPNDFDRFLRNFLCKYIVDNHMDPNVILLEEIKNLMKYDERYWVNIISLILDCINSVEIKLQGVQTILNCAKVPWSDTFIFWPSLPKYREKLIQRFDEALHIIDNNNADVQHLCLLTETIVKDKLRLQDETISNFYTVAGSLFKRLNKNSNEFERSFNDTTLDLIKNVYNLRKHFGIRTTALKSHSDKNKIIDEILENVRLEFENEKQTIDEVFATCHKLSVCLSCDYHDILLRFCEKTGDYNFIVRTAEKFHDRETSTRNFCLMAILLLRYIGAYKLSLGDSFSDSDRSLVVADSERVVSDDVFCKGLRIATSIVAKAMAKAEPDELMPCMEVVNWVYVAFHFTGSQESDLSKLLFRNNYRPLQMVSGFHTFSAIKLVFNTFCGFVAHVKSTNSAYLTHFKNQPLTEEEFMHELQPLIPILENLSKDGQHYTSFVIVSTLTNCLMQYNPLAKNLITTFDKILKKKCIPKLLSVVVSSNTIDTDLLNNLLQLCDREDATKFILNALRMYKRHPRKFECLTRTGLKICDHYELTDYKRVMMDSLITLKWWKRFEGHKIPYDKFFKSKPEQRFELLINTLDCFHIEWLNEFCKDYKLEPQTCYLFYLKRVLQNWKPDYEIKSDDTNRRFLIVKNSEVELLAKCREIMQGLNNEQISGVVRTVRNSINTYYYEVFITILDILCEVDPQESQFNELAMLQFLKNYQRVSKASQIEIEQWFTNFPDAQTVDVLSEFRLAFTPLLFTSDIFTIIRPEINLKTYHLWFNTIEILRPHLSKNQICSYVVKHVVASGVLSKSDETWVLNPKHDDLLRAIDECVNNITDPELATSVMYHVMTNTCPGLDQVKAASLCYKYATKYRQLNPDSSAVEKAVTKVEKKYYMYRALHILNVHHLTDSKYIDLLTHPNDLILALYLDDRILDDFHCVEINKASEALAELFQLDIKKIRLKLINSWLDDQALVDFDSSVIESNCSEESCLKRIAYICSGDQVTYWQTVLLEIGQKGESVRCRANALRVFAMISDVETIETMAEMSYDRLMLFINRLTLVGNLEYLGFGVDVAVLDHTNRQSLLNRLVQQGGNAFAIKTMALYCMTYQIYGAKYWEFVLNNAVKFSLFTELKTYVTFLSKSKYQYKGFYINAWQKLIDYYFSNLNCAKNLDQTLLKHFLTIQSCPVLFSLDFNHAFAMCLEVKKAEFAAVLLQYLQKNDTYFSNVEKVRNCSKEIMPGLNYLDQNGILGISNVREILHNSV
ncbi:hypothetical protein TcasGA2_TC034281 [Tribolium castaneum]|uniref:Uncharacterized protein n=1 Tax=Tribolium castaneum TaxID=7070 RepID=A0A139WCI3_TRICA|nr:hypothetical protein TcasGA2_TC034281 [Tribolium castaneum]